VTISEKLRVRTPGNRPIANALLIAYRKGTGGAKQALIDAC